MIKRSLMVMASLLMLSGCGRSTDRSDTTPETYDTPGMVNGLMHLSAEDGRIVTPDGESIALRGCNLGSWLMMEPSMLDFDSPLLMTERQVWDFFDERFGPERTISLIRAFRDHFITKEDIQRIASLGLNLVRIPIWHRAILDPGYAGSEEWIDKAVSWCGEAGVYVILDLHGAPGGQNLWTNANEDGPNAAFWSIPSNQDTAILFWKRLAMRYRDNPIIAAFDILNEGIPEEAEQLFSFYDRCIEAIRDVDPNRMIILQDGQQGLNHMPRPVDRGWSNVVYSTHIFPKTASEGINAPERALPNLQRIVEDFSVPLFIGEFNTGTRDLGGIESLAEYIRLFDYYSTSWCLWSYKQLESRPGKNWALTGHLAHDYFPDLETAKYKDVLAAFNSLESRSFEENPLLAAALQPSAIPSIPEPPPGVTYHNIRRAHMLPGAEDGLNLEWFLGYPLLANWTHGDGTMWTVDSESGGSHTIGIHAACPTGEIAAQLWLNGILQATPTLQGTGSWSDFQFIPMGTVMLEPGRNCLEIRPILNDRPFFNLKGLWSKEARAGDSTPQETAIWLKPSTLPADPSPRTWSINWIQDIPFIDTWPSDTPVNWTVNLRKGGLFRVAAFYATIIPGQRLHVLVDDERVSERRLPATGGWTRFQAVDLGSINLGPGHHTISIMPVALSPDSLTINLRDIRLQKSHQKAGDKRGMIEHP